MNNKILNFYNFFEYFTKCNKDKTFYNSPKKSGKLKYKDILRIIRKFGYFLNKIKVFENKKIVVIFDNSKSLVLLFLSIIYNQRIFIPIDPNSTIFEIEYIIKKTKPSLIIVDKNLQKKVQLKKSNIEKIYLQENIFWNSLDKNYDEKKQKFNLKKDQISQILFTSGSTGKPKGVILTHESMITNLIGLYKGFGIKSKNLNFLSITPLYHNNGQFIPTLLPFFFGGTTFSISPTASFLNFWPVCNQLKINYCSVMATHINFFNKTIKANKNSLKILFCGGAKLDPISQKLFEKKFNTKILCNYGLTETSSIASSESNTFKNKYGSVGKPLFNNEIKIKKKENDKYGEILIKGKNLFKEYLNQKNLTKKKYEKKWFKTGDLGYLDSDGYLFIKDRIDNMIIVSGENIYPSEIENYLYDFKKIKLGIVCGLPDEITQNKLVLIYEGEKKINYKKFYEYLSKRLVKFKIPKFIIHIEKLKIKEIPKAANKKILRKKINIYLKNFALSEEGRKFFYR